MFYSEANLLTTRVAGGDSNHPELNTVHLAADGSTVAFDGRAFLAVGPVPQDWPTWPPGEETTNVPQAGVNVHKDVLKEAMDNLPSKAPAQAKVAGLSRANDRSIQLTTVGRTMRRRIDGQVEQTNNFPDWQQILREATDREPQAQVCVNRRLMRETLKVIDKACGGKRHDPDAPVFLEFRGQDRPLIARARHPKTGQRLVAMFTVLSTGGQWLQHSDWEASILDHKGRKLKRRRKAPPKE